MVINLSYLVSTVRTVKSVLTLGADMRLNTLIKSAVLTATTAIAFSVAPAFAADMTGAGATFPYPIYAKWAGAYKTATGNGLNYQSIGSGGGIKQVKARTGDLGAADVPLKAGKPAADG